MNDLFHRTITGWDGGVVAFELSRKANFDESAHVLTVLSGLSRIYQRIRSSGPIEQPAYRRTVEAAFYLCTIGELVLEGTLKSINYGR